MRLEFFFDYGSPFAYLGSTQLKRLSAETGAQIEYRPILLGGLFRLIGAPMIPIDTFSEPKRRHASKDMMRWAKHWGVDFSFPSRFPMRTVDAMRLTLVTQKEAPNRLAQLIQELFRAYWVHDKDLSDPNVLSGCLQNASVSQALLKEIKLSITTLSFSNHPLFTAPFNIAYSPLT